LVNLYAEPLGNAAIPKKFQQGKAKAVRRSSVKGIAALVLVALLAGGAVYYFGVRKAGLKGAPIPEKSIASTKTAAMTNVRGIAVDAASAIVERLTGAAPAAPVVAAAVDAALKR